MDSHVQGLVFVTSCLIHYTHILIQVTKNEVTHPEPFHFATDSRIRRPTSADQEGEAFEDKGMHREDHHRHQAYHHHSGKVS